MIQRRRPGQEPPSPRSMILRALLLAGLLVAVVLYAQRAGQGTAGRLALFGGN
jgi:hypothetical protein